MGRTRVLKFGGTSLATPELVRSAAKQVASIRASGERVAVVVSAMGHSTDALVALAASVGGASPTPRELDVLLATGEQVSAALFAMALRSLGADAASVTGPRIGIATDACHGRGTIRSVEPREILSILERGGIPVIAGFQGVDAHGDLVTLGRGGSDTTAVAIAAAIRDHEAPRDLARCEILTDVPGIHTADPRTIAEASLLQSISAAAMLQLARAGAQVMHPPAVALSIAARVEVVVREAHPAAGPIRETRIDPDDVGLAGPVAVGLLADRQRVAIGAAGDAPSVAAWLADLATRGVPHLIDRAGPSAIVAAADAGLAADLARRHAPESTVFVESDWSVVSCVGAVRAASSGFMPSEPPSGWWDGEPPTAWWLVRAAEGVGFAKRLLGSIRSAAEQCVAQRNGDYETLGSREGGEAAPRSGLAGTVAP